MHVRSPLFVFISLLLIAPCAAGQIIYVNADSSTGGDGTNWGTAYKYLQDALDVAQDGNDIWVSAGTYRPDDDDANHPDGSGLRTATFGLIAGVSLYGGFAGGEASLDERDWETNETILSGDLLGNDEPGFTNNGENSYHVVTGNDTDETAVLDGLTITAGNADDNWQDGNASGGGIYNYEGSITLTNCTIADNYATGRGSKTGGGGIYNYAGNMTLTDCTIADNYAADGSFLIGGGGIYNSDGNMTLTDCAFIGNSTSYDGGGMYNVWGKPTLTNCTFISNSAGRDGGGFSNDYEDVTVANCMFSGNSAGRWGGGLFNSHFGSTVNNCAFIDNTAEMGGGVGSYYLYLRSLTLTNCTFSGNSADDLGGAVSNRFTEVGNYVKLTNCILWDNSASEGPQVAMEHEGDLYTSYCCVEGGDLDVYAPHATLFWDESNIGGDLVNDNPLFVTGPLGDYYLSQTGAGQGTDSPCVDAGSDTAINLGMYRFATRTNEIGDSGIVDMGYHYSTMINAADADIDRDGDVDFIDYALLAGQWREELRVSSVDADIAPPGGDGVVDVNDLAFFVEHWQDCFVTAASNPSPGNNQGGVDPNVILSWSAGEFAVLYDVYLGTDFDDVNDASLGWAEYMGTFEIIGYDPCGLEFETTYYWRIDEKNNSCMVKGDVWSFKTWQNEPVGWWEFEEGGGGTAYDSAGNNHGTLHGDPNWVGGQIGGALDFDGDGDYVEIPDDDSLTPSNEITIAFWLYNRGGQTAGIYKYASCPDFDNSPGYSRAYYIQASEGGAKLQIFSSANNYDSLSSIGGVSLNHWHHIAATFDRGDAVVYIDGQLDNSGKLSVSSISNDAQPLIIGGYWDYCGTDNFLSRLNGIIDDVRIYNRALSSGEIWDIYQAGLGN